MFTLFVFHTIPFKRESLSNSHSRRDCPTRLVLDREMSSRNPENGLQSKVSVLWKHGCAGVLGIKRSIALPGNTGLWNYVCSWGCAVRLWLCRNSHTCLAWPCENPSWIQNALEKGLMVIPLIICRGRAAVSLMRMPFTFCSILCHRTYLQYYSSTYQKKAHSEFCHYIKKWRKKTRKWHHGLSLVWFNEKMLPNEKIIRAQFWSP